MKIFSGKNPTEAHIVCQLLLSEGIDAEVRGEGIFGLKGELPMTDDTDPYVWLLDDGKQEQAMQLVGDYRTQATQSSANWQCVDCGEENEGHFGACWNCGSPAPRI